MPSQVSKKNNRWLSQGATGGKFAATTYGAPSTIPEENIPYNTLAKKKTKRSIERDMEKDNKFRALDAWGMWQSREKIKKAGNQIEIDRLGRFGLDGSVNAIYKEKGID